MLSIRTSTTTHPTHIVNHCKNIIYCSEGTQSISRSQNFDHPLSRQAEFQHPTSQSELRVSISARSHRISYSQSQNRQQSYQSQSDINNYEDTQMSDYGIASSQYPYQYSQHNPIEYQQSQPVAQSQGLPDFYSSAGFSQARDYLPIDTSVNLTPNNCLPSRTNRHQELHLKESANAFASPDLLSPAIHLDPVKVLLDYNSLNQRKIGGTPLQNSLFNSCESEFEMYGRIPYNSSACADTFPANTKNSLEKQMRTPFMIDITTMSDAEMVMIINGTQGTDWLLNEFGKAKGEWTDIVRKIVNTQGSE